MLWRGGVPTFARVAAPLVGVLRVPAFRVTVPCALGPARDRAVVAAACHQDAFGEGCMLDTAQAMSGHIYMLLYGSI
jgi:sugar lactone lactonase YvrE